MLVHLGCDLAQGWLFGRPVNAKSILSQRGQRPQEPLPVDLSTNQCLAELEAIYAGAPIGLCFVDRQLRVLKTNPRFAGMLATKMLEGRSLSEFFPAATAALERDRDAYGTALSTATYHLTRGTSTPCQVNVAPARDEFGEIIGFFMVVV
ncbi:PAS domain-containing protein [Caballeronia pedi]|nr:PAS domain-containing protein [Caballeronia pedi]